MANRSENRGVGRRKDGAFVPAEQLIQVGIKMAPDEVAAAERRDARRDDGGRGPAMRTALAQVEAILAWTLASVNLAPAHRAQLGLLLDELDVIGDAALQGMRLDGQARACHRDELAELLQVPEEDLTPAVALLEREGLVLVRPGLPAPTARKGTPAPPERFLVLAVDPPAGGPGAARLERLALARTHAT